MNQCIIAPSLLAADFGRIAEESRRAFESGADWLHLDVMDGNFVDNISFGPAMVATVRKAVPNKFLDVHLMIERPDHYLQRFIDAGSDLICIHVEPVGYDVRKTLQRIREAGLKSGLALNPATPLEAVEPYLGEIDLLLCMSVVPGFGGQSFMEDVMPKISKAKILREQLGLNFVIEVDGGIASSTIGTAARAGVDVFVAGSSTYSASNMTQAISTLREIACNAHIRQQ